MKKSTAVPIPFILNPLSLSFSLVCVASVYLPFVAPKLKEKKEKKFFFI